MKVKEVVKEIFDSKQLEMGIKVEKEEHNKSKKEAEEIAKDHLREHPKYYTYLRRMEKKLEK